MSDTRTYIVSGEGLADRLTGKAARDALSKPPNVGVEPPEGSARTTC